MTRLPAGARALLLLPLLFLHGCDGGLFHPGGDPLPADFAVSLPSMDLLAGQVEGGIGDAFRKVDRVRVAVQTSAGAFLLDETLPVTSTEQEIHLRVEIPLDELETGVSLLVEMSRGADLLFQGADAFTLERGRTTQAEVTPQPVPAGIEFPGSPAPMESLGDEVQLEAVVVFATGDVIPGLVPTWNSLDPEIVDVSEQGLAVAVGPGTARVQATHEGLSAVLDVEVRLVAASLAVDPESLALAEGDTATLTVTAEDARGNAFAPDRLAWSSSDPEVAQVSPEGLVTGLLPGLATIHVGQDGIELEVPVQVRARTHEILLDPDEAELGVGESLLLAVTVLDPRGDPIVPPEVEWSSSDPAVATVDQEGEVTGVRVGEVEIRASRDGVTGTAVVTVVQTAASIEIDPPEFLRLRVGETTAFTAIVLDGSGNPIEPPEVEWSSSAPLVARVDQDGVVTGVDVGEVEIRASRNGVTEAARVTVIERVPRVLSSEVLLSVGPDDQRFVQFQALIETFGFPGVMFFTVLDDLESEPIFIQAREYPGSVTPVPDSSDVFLMDQLLGDPGVYHLQVVASNTFGEEAGEPVPFLHLPAPSDVFAFDPFDGQPGVEVWWQYGSPPPTGVVYQIQRRLGAEAPWTTVTTTSGTPTGEADYLSYRDQSADELLEWRYRIRACHSQSGNCSPYSQEVLYFPGSG
jgi:uncharacterized protein YjdB